MHLCNFGAWLLFNHSGSSLSLFVSSRMFSTLSFMRVYILVAVCLDVVAHENASINDSIKHIIQANRDFKMAVSNGCVRNSISVCSTKNLAVLIPVPSILR